jgi:hypothetical protein
MHHILYWASQQLSIHVEQQNSNIDVDDCTGDD